MDEHISCVIDSGAYQFQTTKLQNKRTSPYIMRWPAQLTESFSGTIANTMRHLEVFSEQTTHYVVGIANSGIGISKLVTRGLRDLNCQVSETIISLNNLSEFSLRNKAPSKVIIVDNAVTTGITLKKVTDYIRSFGHSVETAIRFFDREEVEPNGTTIQQMVKNELSLELYSTVTIRDILPILPKNHVMAIRLYLIRYGTQSIRNFMEENNVLKQ